MRVADVTVMEADGRAVVTFIRSGDISSGSRFTVDVVPGTATTRKLPTIHECTHLANESATRYIADPARTASGINSLHAT